MGTILDSTVFISLEKALRRGDPSTARTEVARYLRQELGDSENVGMAAITAAELLHGVHRADVENRPPREAFVESMLQAFPPIPFDLVAARVYSGVWANLVVAGTPIAAHDMLVAATAITLGWGVATENLRHFNRVKGLVVKELSFTLD